MGLFDFFKKKSENQESRAWRKLYDNLWKFGGVNSYGIKENEWIIIEKLLEKLTEEELVKIASTYAGHKTNGDMLRTKACGRLGHILEGCFCKRCTGHFHEYKGCKCNRCGHTEHNYIEISVSALPKGMQDAAYSQQRQMIGVVSEIQADKCSRCNDFRWVVINRD
jgi:hypothetical protein